MTSNSDRIKTASNQNKTTITYKIDTGMDGNIMPIHIFKYFFHGNRRTTSGNKNESTVLKRTKQKIPQLNICSVKITKINKSCANFCNARKWSSSARHAKHRKPRCPNNQLQNHRHMNTKTANPEDKKVVRHKQHTGNRILQIQIAKIIQLSLVTIIAKKKFPPSP